MRRIPIFAGAVCVAVLLSVLLVSCFQEKAEQPEGTQQDTAAPKHGSSGATGDTVKTGQEQDVTGKYDPVIEMTTVTSHNTLVQFDKGDNIDNNAWTRQIEQDYGVKVKRIWSVTSPEEYDQKLNLMIASGDIPDFFMVSPIQFNQLQEADLLEDLTEAYTKHAPPLVKQMIEEAGPEVLQSATIDGKLMALPWTGLAKESVPVVWIRRDWMKQLKLKEPDSMDDLLAISKAFANGDPDGNGKKDTYGFLMDRELFYMRGLFNAFHAYPGIWIKESSGKLAFGSIQPEMKTVLSVLRDMYADGQLDPEFAVKSPTKSLELIGANKVGILMGDLGQANWPLSTNLPGVEWQSYAVPSADDQAVKLQHELNIFGNYWVVKKGVKHPEAIMKMAELFVQYFYFNTDERIQDQFIQPKDAKKSSSIWMLAPVKLYRPFNNLEVYRAMETVRKGEKTVADLTISQKEIYDRIESYHGGDKSLWWAAAQSGENGSGRIIEQYLTNDQFMPNEFITKPTATMTERYADMNDLANETFAKIIMGTASVDEFDKFVAVWKTMGGDLITQEVNDWYSKQK